MMFRGLCYKEAYQLHRRDRCRGAEGTYKAEHSEKDVIGDGALIDA